MSRCDCPKHQLLRAELEDLKREAKDAYRLCRVSLLGAVVYKLIRWIERNEEEA